MTRNERKAAIENTAEMCMNIENLEAKSTAFMIISAYIEGKAAGKAEERKKWEQKQAAVMA